MCERERVQKQVPPRFELGSLDSESRVLTITPWNQQVGCPPRFHTRRFSHDWSRKERQVCGTTAAGPFFDTLARFHIGYILKPPWSGWPSGLRRCVQVAVSPGGVGSNPTSDILLSLGTRFNPHTAATFPLSFSCLHVGVPMRPL